MTASTTRVYTKTPHRTPDVVSAAQRQRAAELELMYDLMRELTQHSAPVRREETCNED